MTGPTHVGTLGVCALLLAVTAALPLQPTDVSGLVQNVAIDLLSSVGKNLSPNQESAAFDLETPTKKVYNLIQTVLLNVLRPQPIIDTIREEEKYGNDGERFAKVGRKVVGGVETLTNLLATAVDAPFTALKSITRKASESLNNLGSKLVGL